jgi:hypothetical protein
LRQQQQKRRRGFVKKGGSKPAENGVPVPAHLLGERLKF